MTTLYKISVDGLQPVRRSALANEAMLEGWIVKNPSTIGLDVLVIGQQVVTDHNGRIDILAIDRNGDLCIVELKRDKTPRDIVGQVLDYASWVSGLSTKQVHEIAMQKLDRRLDEAFRECFDTPLPENLNANHSMVIVASEFDSSSKRIVEYLAEQHGLSINTAFFSIFEQNGEQLLATDWLMDQQEVVERAESKKKAPWTGYYYVNAGDAPNKRSWEDMKKYGFVSAGGGRFYSQRLNQLSPGDPVYAYQKGRGYIGFGIVTAESVMIKDFRLADGRSLTEVCLGDPGLLLDADDSELAEYIVAVEWKKALPISEAKTFSGVFANQNIVCKLTHPATLDFLATEFGTVNMKAMR